MSASIRVTTLLVRIGEGEQREALHGGHDDHEERGQHDGPRILGVEGIEGRLDQDRVEARRAGHQGDQHEHQGQVLRCGRIQSRHRRLIKGRVSPRRMLLRRHGFFEIPD